MAISFLALATLATVSLAPSKMPGALTEEYVRNMAAEEEFSAAYCCVPLESDEADAWVQTFILLVRAYHPGGKLVDAFYPASNAAYHAAQRLADKLAVNTGARFERLSHVRLKPICNRLPIFGRGINTLNYLSEVGSRFCLELLGTDALVGASDAADTTGPRLQCASCQRCVSACPTGAIAMDGFDRTRCIRNYMLSGKAAPEAQRNYIGAEDGAMGIVGCDICQRVCPYNAIAEKNRKGEDVFSLQEMLSCTPETLARFASLYGKNYANRNRIVAQAILAAANAKDENYLKEIRLLTQSASPLVREHANWAIEKMEEIQK